MTNHLTLFEHEAQPFDWQPHHLALLERLRTTVGAEVLRPMIRRGQKVLQAAQYVGVVRFGRETVQILPKMYRASQASGQRQRVHEATRNLLYMLSIAGEVDTRIGEAADLLRQEYDWFELLTAMFAHSLSTAWRQGPVRAYQMIEDELPLLKGRWRIAEQLRRPDRKHRFAVAYDEFTVDTLLNRVLRFVVERLYIATRDAANRRVLGELRQVMDEVTLLPVVSAADAQAVRITRLNARFRLALQLARLFLEGAALQPATGDLSAFAFVFDMNRLFESFIAALLQRHHTILPPALQTCTLVTQARGISRSLARRDGQRVFCLEPDIAFVDGQHVPLLLDTKYKQVDDLQGPLAIAQSDIYQMYAYVHRYNCPRVILLYPQTTDTARRDQFVLEDGSGVITAATVDLRDDLALLSTHAALLNRLHTILKDDDDHTTT